MLCFVSLTFPGISLIFLGRHRHRKNVYRIPIKSHYHRMKLTNDTKENNPCQIVQGTQATRQEKAKQPVSASATMLVMSH